MIPNRKNIGIDIVSYLTALLFAMFAHESRAQELPPDVCELHKGELVFTIDLRWTEQQRELLVSEYDLDSSMVAGIFKGKRKFFADGENWEAVTLDSYHVKLQKPVRRSFRFFDLLTAIITRRNYNFGIPGYVNEPLLFGFNRFSEPMIEILDSGQVLFTLPGFADAGEVFIAGSFNNWLNKDIALKKNDSVWQTSLSLAPGKYFYKYIVDGQWITDPNNMQTEFDGVSADNSVLYVTNYTFRLDSTEQLQNVIVSGTFNDWDTLSSRMQKTEYGFELPVYLANGCHKYVFWSEGERFADPDNPSRIRGNDDELYSQVCIGDPVTFRLKGFPEAQQVYLTGSFNQWQPDEIPMQKNDSLWEKTIYLSPGNYEYKFIADGQWMPDPDNPRTHGTGAYVNSFFVYKPNHLFVLEGFEDAKEVMVTGSFNEWILHGYKMQRKNNRWELELFLPKGKTAYKFIVDGKWMTDPANPNYERNETGSFNSIIWKE